MEQPVLILFGHGARDPQWAAPMVRVREEILAADPAQRVELAFLEFIAPTLPECVDALVAAGKRRVTVVPMFIAQSGHLKRDLPEILDQLRQRHPGLDIQLTSAVGEAPDVIRAMARFAMVAARPA